MANQIGAMHEKRCDLLEKMDAILAGARDADGGKRDLTPGENLQFQRVKAGIDAIDSDIAQAESAMLRKSNSARPQGQQIDHPVDYHQSGTYSLSRLIRSIADHSDSPELELSRALQKQHGGRGTMIPFALEKTSVAGTLAAGGALVSPFYSSLVERLIAPSLVARLPVNRMALPAGSGELVLPKLKTGVVAGWTAENADAAETSPTFGQVQLTPHRLTVYSTFSRMLVMSSQPSIDNILMADMATALATALDSALLNGTGNVAPTGIVGQAGATLLESGADNLYGLLCEAVSTLETSDVGNDGTIAWLASPNAVKRLRSSFVQNSVDASDGAPILAPGAGVLGFPMFVSTHLAPTQVLLARWSDVIVASWSAGLDTIVDPYSLAPAGNIRLVSELYADVALRHQESLVALQLTS